MEDFNPANINGYAKVIARPVAKRAPNKDMEEGVLTGKMRVHMREAVCMRERLDKGACNQEMYANMCRMQVSVMNHLSPTNHWYDGNC